jgi:Flp pilus assembly protein TadG
MSKRILFVVAAVLLAVAGWYFRSVNAKSAHDQASHIIAQDQAGAATDAAQASLTAYVKSHMGSSVTYTLNGSYTRAEATAKAAATATTGNSQIYADAQKACSGKSDSITQAKCNQDYLAKHLVNVPAPSPVAPPKPADYQRNLQAPIWTPDITGALWLGAAAALVFALLSFRGRR